MENLRHLYNREDLLDCIVYQINLTSKQRLYNIESKTQLDIFINNRNKGWGLNNLFMEFRYFGDEIIILSIKDNK